MYTRAEYLSIATVTGTVVGAGIFGLPFMAAQSGFWIVAGYVVALGAIITVMHLLYGEIVLRTRDHHFLPGYAAKYLGPWGKRLALTFILPGLVGTMLAYSVVSGQFLAILLGGLWSIDAFTYGFIFNIIGVLLVLGRIRLIADFELGVLVLLLLTVVGITLGAMPFFEVSQLSQIAASPWIWLLPYGVVLYAVSGFESIPEVREIFEATPDGHRSSYVKAILTGTLIPAFIYVIFTAAVLGVTGSQTTEEALRGLAQSQVAQVMVKLAALFGILATISAYVIMADNLRKIFWYDLGFSKHFSWWFVVGLALVIYWFNRESFVSIIGIIGAVAGGLGGAMTVVIHRRSQRLGNRRPEYKIALPLALASLLIVIFVFGAGYQLWSLFS